MIEERQAMSNITTAIVHRRRDFRYGVIGLNRSRGSSLRDDTAKTIARRGVLS